MTTPTDALRKAAAEIGYYAPADPQPGSKYGRWEAERLGEPWLAGPSTQVWWCAIFVSWVLDGIATMPGLPGYTCNTIRGHCAQQGALLGNVHDAQPGDVIFYDWNHNGSLDHVGIVELNKGSHVQTIEGNTSSGTGGSQSAGNGVWRRTRDWNAVTAVARPTYAAAPTPPPAPAPAPAAPAGLAVDGFWGSDTTRRLQAVLGTPVDGVISSQDDAWRAQNPALTTGWEWVRSGTARGSQAIAALQRVVGSPDDGRIGPATIRAFQTRMGTPVDGVLSRSSRAVAELQRRLNENHI